MRIGILLLLVIGAIGCGSEPQAEQRKLEGTVPVVESKENGEDRLKNLQEQGRQAQQNAGGTNAGDAQDQGEGGGG